jgi:tetratricopeptide (TPR) repeat protein
MNRLQFNLNSEFIVHAVFTLVIICSLSCADSKETRIQRFLIQGNEQVERRNPQQAIEYYNAALHLDSCFADAWNNLGTIYFNQRDYEEAIRHYDRAIDCRRDYSDAYLNRANAFYEHGELFSALKDLHQVGKLKPDTVGVHFLKALCYTKLRNYDEAIVSFRRALELSPANVDLRVNLGTVYFYRKDYDSARSILTNVLETGSEEPNAYNTLALLETAEGNHSLALDWINKALNKKPDDPFFLNNRGYIFLMIGQLQPALKDIDASIIGDPYNGWAYRNKGIFYIQQKNYADAIRLLTQAEEMDPRIENIYFYLGHAHFLNGNKNQACAFWHESKKMKEEASQKITYECD